MVMKNALVSALALSVALLVSAAPLRAQTPAALSAAAAPGPRGMIVRWFPHEATRELVATVVRIDPTGARVALGQVRRPTTDAARATNKRIDTGGTGTFAEFGTLDLALTRGVAYVDNTATKGIQYRYEVALADGERGTSNLSPPAGTRPPVAHYRVTSLSAKAGDRKVELTMQSVTGHGNFNIYRSADGRTFARVGSALGTPSGTHYIDSPAPTGVRTGYRVTVVDAFDNEGPPSTVVYATAQDLHRPLPVTALEARAGTNEVALSWNGVADPSIASYQVLRGIDDAKVTPLATVSSSAQRYDDRVAAGHIYHYDVVAKTRAGILGYASGGATAVVGKTTPPDAPANLVAKAQRDGIVLAWQASRDSSVHMYNVYRRAESGAPFLLAQVPSTTRSFNVQVPIDSVTSYAYGVGAQDRFGNAVLPSRWVTERPLRSSLPVSSKPAAVRLGDGVITVSVVPLVDPDITAQRLYRGDNGNAARAIATLKPAATLYSDRALQPGHSYAYALAAIARGGSEGTRSAQVAISIPTPRPNAPAVSARLLSDGVTVELRWPQTNGIAGYTIVRRGPDGATVTIAPLVRAFAYRDALPRGAHGTYAYALRILTTAGASPLGPFASVSR